MVTLYDDVKVIDADTHFTEPPDMWTSRAPVAYKDRVLHIEERNGVPTWVADDAELGFANGGGVIDHVGGKIPYFDSSDKGIDWVHPGAWDVNARLRVMDECGIHAQVLFPNAVGLGGNKLNTLVQDETLRLEEYQARFPTLEPTWLAGALRGGLSAEDAPSGEGTRLPPAVTPPADSTGARDGRPSGFLHSRRPAGGCAPRARSALRREEGRS